MIFSFIYTSIYTKRTIRGIVLKNLFYFKEGKMKRTTTALLLVLFVGMMGCSTAQKGAAVGGLGGATLGGIIGHQSGNGIAGAAIGGVVGTVGGMVVGEKMDKKFCPVCGATFTTDAKYCPKDGTELKVKQ
jgi:ribosomal protein L40E